MIKPGFPFFLLNDFLFQFGRSALLLEDCGNMDLDMLEEVTAAESASEAVPMKHLKQLH